MSPVALSDIWRRYEPPGPVAQAQLIAPEPITALMGPWGSGKTTLEFFKGLLLSTLVPPSPVDGVRYAKGVVIRDNYRNLDNTTIETFLSHFPREWGTFTGGGGGPAESIINFQLDDHSMLEQTIVFAAIGDTNLKSFTDGFEANWAFINGGDTVPAETVAYMFGRLGRWPPPQHRADNWAETVPLWKKLSEDFNAPDLDNHRFDYYMERKIGSLFVQPSGFAPNAENLKNLPPGYYDDLAKMNADKLWWIRRFIENKWGYSREGKPVFENFDPERHISKLPLKFDNRRKVVVGLDAGRNPAAVPLQRGFQSGVNFLGELVPDERMGATRFGEQLSQYCVENFPGAEIEGRCDPAALDPTQDTDDDHGGVWAERVSDICGFPIFGAAENNDWTPRYEAIDCLLRDTIEGRPALQTDPQKCPKLNRSLASGYRFGSTKVHGSDVLTNRPVKDKHSHVAEAAMYGCQGSSDERDFRRRSRSGHRHTTVEVDPSW